MLSNAHVLIGSGVEIGGCHFWGSPVNPYSDMPFGMSGQDRRRKYWAGIPADTNVLITHMPPYGVLDGTGEGWPHQGCVELAEAVSRVEPLLHVFGHVHSEGGEWRHIQNTLYVNASLAGADGLLDKEPQVMQLKRSVRN
jgi:Icc-related predicted phosphoesterase